MSADALRVLHVTQPTTEGVGRHVRALVGDQVQRGWQVALACPERGGLGEASAAVGVRWLAWDARRAPGASVARELAALRRVVAEVEPDVVHLHSSKAGLVGRLVLRGRVPTLFTPHAWSFLAGGPVLRRVARLWERGSARWVEAIVCVSRAELERAQRARISARMEVIPNGVDLDVFVPATPVERAAARAAQGLGPGPSVVCIGRLAPQKGQDLLLEAWGMVSDRVPGATLVLVGDGPERHALAARAGSDVRFVGEVADVRPFYASADVVAAPSRWEGLSYVVLEALASGRSIVASDVDGMLEALGRGAESSGVLVPVADVAALAAALAERLADPALREREERQARVRAQRFDLRSWGTATADLVRSVARPE